jgi:hypothetical protein
MHTAFSFLRPCAGLARLFLAPIVGLGFLPLIAGLASAAPSIAGAIGGGGKAPAGPISNTANFGAVNFGAKYIGSDAVAAAPTIIAAEDKSWTKYIPWAVGGVVALFALILFAGRRRN